MTPGERRAVRMMALDLQLGTHEAPMAHAALSILDKPWDPLQSTAQPPIVCGHACVQFQRHHRPPRWACSVCGHETGWRPGARR